MAARKSRVSSDGNRDTGMPYPIIATRLERNWSMWIRHFRNTTEAATHQTTVTALHPPMRIAVSNKLNFSFPFPRSLSFSLSIFHPSNVCVNVFENATRDAYLGTFGWFSNEWSHVHELESRWVISKN